MQRCTSEGTRLGVISSGIGTQASAPAAFSQASVLPTRPLDLDGCTGDPRIPQFLDKVQAEIASQPAASPERLVISPASLSARKSSMAGTVHPIGIQCVIPTWAIREEVVTDISQIKEHMEVIGADGAHVGTVDHLEGDRIKLTKKDSGEGSHEGHHHYISTAMVADIEGNQVRLSANADVAVTFEEESDGSQA
jgi:hypothetical protein